MSKLIGRVLATEKAPTTMDEFNFWTNSDMKLHAFDIVKVEHIEGSFTFGVIENISHIPSPQCVLRVHDTRVPQEVQVLRGTAP